MSEQNGTEKKAHGAAFSNLDEGEDRCMSCDSSNVKIYIKYDLMFMVCHDCERKQLLD